MLSDNIFATVHVLCWLHAYAASKKRLGLKLDGRYFLLQPTCVHDSMGVRKDSITIITVCCGVEGEESHDVIL